MDNQTEISLQALIEQGDTLSEARQESLYNLLAPRARQHNRDRLRRRLKHPLSLWPSYGIYRRVTFEGDRASYCAGQEYRGEITYIRNLIIGGNP